MHYGFGSLPDGSLLVELQHRRSVHTGVLFHLLVFIHWKNKWEKLANL